MKIAIPSYKRATEILTINTLVKHNIPLSCIYLFVADETEKSLYSKTIPNEIQIIVGVVGISAIRNFITDYFEEGEIIICMDDDIRDFIIIEKSLLHVLNDSIAFLENSPYQLIGFPATDNKYFLHDLSGYQIGLKFCVGVFFIVKNDKSFRVENRLTDFQITLMSYEKYGAVIWCSDIMFKTKYWGKNGLEEERKRIGYYKYYSDVCKIQYKYSKYLTAKTKKVSLYDFPLPSLKVYKNEKRNVIQFANINPKLFDTVLQMLDSISLKTNKAYVEGISNTGRYRKNFPAHRSIVYGMIENRPAIMQRYKKELYDLSRHTKEKPHIWEELERIGDIICPFPFSTCYICKNTVAGKHYDANNVGMSCIVSIGDYTGCNLIIENKKYNAKYNPIVFDGSRIQHWNTDDLSGNKYSLVFYNILKK